MPSSATLFVALETEAALVKVAGGTISVIVEPSSDGGEKGAIFGGRKPERRDLPIALLRDQLKAETAKLLAILDAVPSTVDWKLNEVEIGVDITAEGGISFIGTATLSAAASLKLKFSR